MRLLIVEDEPEMIAVINTLVENYNKDIEIVSCSNPYQAMKAFDEQPADAAFLDIKMPEMTGLELADYLTMKKPDINLVFVTAYNNYAQEAFDVNAVDYVLKPIRQERLNRALDKIYKEVDIKRNKYIGPQSEVKIQTFGKIVIFSGESVLKWKRKKSQEVFAYLLFQDSVPVHKEVLCELMWPDCEPQRASHYLQTIIHQMRKSIAEIAGNKIVIEYADHSYRIRLEGVDYDIRRFLDSYQRAFTHKVPSAEALIETEQIYCGLYYGEECWIWALGKQQDLAIKYQRVLEKIIEYKMKEDNIDEGLYYINKWFANGFYGHQNEYGTWIRQKTGAAEQRLI